MQTSTTGPCVFRWENGDLSRENGDLSKENCDLSKENGDLSKENGDLSARIGVSRSFEIEERHIPMTDPWCEHDWGILMGSMAHHI